MNSFIITKRNIVILVFFALLQSLVYQGCGGPESFTNFSTNPLVNKLSKNIDAIEGDQVDLSVPTEELDKLGLNSNEELEIIWSFIGDGVEKTIENDETTLIIEQVKLEDAGIYTVSIKNEQSSLLFTIALSVQKKADEPTPEPILALYEGFFIEDGEPVRFIRTEEITREDALANCQLNAESNPTRSILCEWNGDEIYKRIIEIELGTYKGYFIENGTNKLFIETKDISEEDALANCKENADANPKKSILCTWNDKEIFNKIVEPEVVRGLYKGFFIEGDAFELFIQTRDITRADALANCKKNADNNPKKSLFCTWNGKEIFRKIVEPEVVKGLYEGFFIDGDALELFIQTRGITRADALANCKKNAKANPKRSLFCTWNGKEIFRKIVEAPKKGTYKGFFIGEGSKHLFIKTKNITRAAALKNCQLNAKNNPLKSVICTFNNTEIFRRMAK